MPRYYTEQIAAIDGVEVVAPQNWFGGIYIDNRPEHFFSRFAVEPDTIFNLYREFEIPQDQYEAFANDRQGMAIGARTAERVGLKIGQRITIQGDIYPFDLKLTIRAIFHGPNDDWSFFHQKYLEESLPPEWGGMVGFFGIRAASRKYAATALEIVGLGDRLDHYPRQLSGGQEQRVAIARALLTDPKILLADEPTGDLDAASAKDILEILTVLNRDHGKTVIMVTHEPGAAKYAHVVRHLEKGNLLPEGQLTEA